MAFILKRCDQYDSQHASATVHATAESGFGAIQCKAGNLPLKQLGYHARMTGLAVRTTILQTYYNPFDEAIEATYIFPIEGQQAVVACQFHVADRVVRARLKERGAARAEYDRAIRAGYRAALLEENRPETFSMRVGNIPPGEAVQVCIETVGQLDVVHGEWTLRLPLVVAPRYTSGIALPFPAAGDGVGTDTYEVPDASTVTPPTWLPGFASPVDLRLAVDINLAHLAYPTWTSDLESSLHSVLVEKSHAVEGQNSQDSSLHSAQSSANRSSESCRIQVMPGERVNRDFILRGRVPAESPVCSLTVEQAIPEATPSQPAPNGVVTPLKTFALTIVPPRVTERAARDVAFVLDRSGSMGGWKMQAARRGIGRLIDSLQPSDRFQLLAFDDSVDHYQGSNGKPRHSALQSDWHSGSDSERFEAVRWLGNVNPRGGTEMGSALKFAFNLFKSPEQSTLRQSTQDEIASPRSRALVLVTDGQITGEDSLMRLLGSIPEPYRPRLYCLGIDGCVNASVMQRLSKFTFGTFELVESEKRLDEVLQRFASEIGSPSISNLTITVDAPCKLQLAPGNAKTLYGQRSLTIYARIDDSNNQPIALNLSGQLASGADWQQTIAAEPSAITEKPVLLPLWGKNRLRELEDEFIADGSADGDLQQDILDCSLKCNVLSRLTAFVAVDESELVTTGGKPHKIIQPSEFPEGWQLNFPRLHRNALLSLRQPVTAAPASTNIKINPVDSHGMIQALLKRKKVSREQVDEAISIAAAQGKSSAEILVQSGYATEQDVAIAIAEACNFPYVKIEDVQIAEEVIELIPESVARENKVLPLGSADHELTVAMQDPNDLVTIEKLRFILNRKINVMVAPLSSIEQAINQYYGQVAGESADSMLQEFTDTAIDFTETESDYDLVDGYTIDTNFDQLPLIGSPLQDLGPVRGGDWVAYGKFATPSPGAGDLLSRLTSGLAGLRIRQAKDSSSSATIRLVNLLIAEAVKLRASHIFAHMDGGAITIQYLIDGKPVTRDSIPGRLCQQLIKHLAELSKIRIPGPQGSQSGTLKITVGSTAIEAKVTLKREMFLIELNHAAASRSETLEVWQHAITN